MAGEVHRQGAEGRVDDRARRAELGGYGDPFERDPAAVLSDVLDGFTTAELAARDYGVVLDTGSMTVDESATATARDRRSAATSVQA